MRKQAQVYRIVVPGEKGEARVPIVGVAKKEGKGEGSGKGFWFRLTL